MRFNNDQEVFKFVKNHLLAQNAVSRFSDGGFSPDDPATCAYRGFDGLKCAVGCLITDEAYFPGLERKNMWDDAVLAALLTSGVDDLEMYSPRWCMLKRLQGLHDNDQPADWGKRLEMYQFDSDGAYIVP